jgi:hypothetical protein
MSHERIGFHFGHHDPEPEEFQERDNRSILIELLLTTRNIIMTLSDLTAAVAQETTVSASLQTLVAGLAANLKAALTSAGQGLTPTQQTAFDAAVTQIQSNNAAEAAALVTNTPAA